MDIYLYAFKKKEKSTAQPLTDPVIIENCILREGTVEAPNIEFGDGLNENYINHNYMYIPKLKRYYYINSWEYHERKWIAMCEEDYMASYKDTIGNCKLQAIRCEASDYQDERLPDSYFPMKSSPNVLTRVGEWENNIFTNNTTYGTGTNVICVLGKDNGGIKCGMSNVYKMTDSQMANFKNYLYSDNDLKDNWDSVQDIVDAKVKSFVNPIQYITSSKYFPIRQSAFTSTDKAVMFGYFEKSGVTGGAVTTSVIGDTCTIDIPKSTGRRAYQYDAPFSNYSLYWSPVGIIELPLKHVKQYGRIQLHTVIDVLTGEGILELKEQVSESKYELFASVNFSCAVDIPLVQGTFNVEAEHNAVQSVTNMVTSAAMSGAVGGKQGRIGVIGSIITGLENYSYYSQQAKYPKISSSGGIGAISSFYDIASPTLICEYFETTETDDSHVGRPSFRNLSPKDANGFIQSNRCDIEITGTKLERDAILDIMESGFYYE